MSKIPGSSQRRQEKAKKRRLKRRQRLLDWQAREKIAPARTLTSGSVPLTSHPLGFLRELFATDSSERVFKPKQLKPLGFNRQAWGRAADGEATEGDPPQLDQ